MGKVSPTQRPQPSPNCLICHNLDTHALWEGHKFWSIADIKTTALGACLPCGLIYKSATSKQSDHFWNGCPDSEKQIKVQIQYFSAKYDSVTFTLRRKETDRRSTPSELTLELYTHPGQYLTSCQQAQR